MSEDPLGYAAGDANLYRYAAGDPVNNVDPDGRIAVYAFWAGVNATLDTAIETGFTYAFGTDEQKADYSIRGTLGKNFAINLATGGLGNKIKWLGRGGQYAFRVAADVLIGTSYDVYANNQDVSTALVSNSLGTAGGEVLGALARRGGRYLARNFQFDTDVLRGAAPTSGFHPFPFRRRAQVGYSQSYAANFDAAFDPAAVGVSQLAVSRGDISRRLAAGRRTGLEEVEAIAGAGPYRLVAGHHVHAKKAFAGVESYDFREAYSLSPQLLSELGVRHSAITPIQQRLFRELAADGLPNNLTQHTRIAYQSLVEAGLPKNVAFRHVAESLKQLIRNNVLVPSHLPWSP